ncbi:hypothetical protein ACHWQZ_G012499 [Mnemiopsis leidyi]
MAANISASIRYENQVDSTELFNTTQDFLSHISLNSKTGARNRYNVRRSYSEQAPEMGGGFIWDDSESRLHRFSSIPLEMTSNQVRFTKDISKEECSSKFLFVSKNCAIVSVFSVLPYKLSEGATNKRKTLSLSGQEHGVSQYAQTTSYAALLEETESSVENYDPFWLENPERTTNSYKTDIVLPGIIVSFLEYENPESFKKDENDQFKEKWPEVDITLSKMKSIKHDLLKVAESQKLPIMVLCYSYCYFETLAFCKYINKANRKLAAGACLMLAKKFLFCNICILSELTEILRVSSRDIIAEEFKVLAALKFSLHYPQSAILPHYERLMGMPIDH